MSSYYKTGQLYPAQKKAQPNLVINQPNNMNGWGQVPELPSIRSSQSPKSATLQVRYKILKHANPGAPEVWGPAFWFSLHNGSIRYPVNPSPLWKHRMKSFIQGIPVMVPCEKCADHATAYIESQSDNLDHAVSTREKLFTFFVDFHNFVNARLGKPEIPIEAANKMYKGTANVLTVEYGP